MKTGIGLPVFPGVSIGPAVVYRKSERTLPVSSGDPAVEQAKFDAARETAREQLAALYEKQARYYGTPHPHPRPDEPYYARRCDFLAAVVQ